jgi:hypothetical protein
MDWIIVVVLFVASMLIGVAVAYRLGPRMGIDVRRLTPSKKRRLAIMLLVSGAVSLLIVWALGTGHTALGIGTLIGALVVPEFVLVPLRIRQSRQRADATRARRQARRS